MNHWSEELLGPTGLAMNHRGVIMVKSDGLMGGVGGSIRVSRQQDANSLVCCSGPAPSNVVELS